MFSKINVLFITCCISTLSIYSSPKTLPDLTPSQSIQISSALIEAHFQQKTFDKLLAKRCLKLFLEELDPLKTYFVKEEIEHILNPSNALLERVLEEYNHGSFAVFEEIYQLARSAVMRRTKIETHIDSTPLPEGVSAKEFYNLDFAKSENELSTRLLRIRSLQNTISKKLATAGSDHFFEERIKKNRLSKEKPLLTEDTFTARNYILTHFIKSLASSLDSHTAYFTPAEANQFLIHVQQKLSGIGALLKDDLYGFTIVNIVEEGPAYQSKLLKEGDAIIAVNHESVVGEELFDAVQKIRGPDGSIVTLTVLRDDEHSSIPVKFDVDILRGEIVLKENRYDVQLIPYGNGQIAHLQLHSFYQDESSSSAEDLLNALAKIKQQYFINGVILDLRNNSGGPLPQAIEISSIFLKRGVITSIMDNTGRVDHLRSTRDKPVWDGPLLVLTNKSSASCSEIVAQTLQDWGRAWIVGDKTTFGKGTCQTFTLDASRPDYINPLGEYKVTRGVYFTASGKTPQQLGAKADIEIPSLQSFLEIGEKHIPYPINNISIEANFYDKFEDLHPFYRNRMRKHYKGCEQQKETFLNKLHPQISKNTALRIQNRPAYQSYLEKAKKYQKTKDDQDLGAPGRDLQLDEAIHVMQDLIYTYPHQETFD